MRQLLLAIVICGFALSQASAKDTTVIAAFGDSLFAGYGVMPEEALPAQLETKLTEDGYHVKIINDGVSGDTTSGGFSRLDNVLSQKPDIAIVEFGANDMLRGFEPSQTRANLELIVSRLHSAGIKLLVVGQKAPLSYGYAYAAHFNSLFCDLARKYDAECYPSYFEGVYGHADLLQADGLHPTAQGLKVVMQGLYPYIVNIIKK